MPRFNQITIVGLGLIGGSLGMAIRRKRLARRVVGLSRTPATIRRAARVGAIDNGTTDARDAVRAAGLVILATPVDLIVRDARRLSPWMRPGSIVSDVGSTKAAITRALGALPHGVAFVGAHPLAGSEKRGIDAAEPMLFDGSVCILTPTRGTDARALAAVRRLWQAVTRRVVTMSPERHDRLLAAVSHLPHLLAFSLVGATPTAALPLAPRSFLEATRVAKSDPDLWDDILLSNRDAVLAGMARFDARWRQFRRALTARDRRRLGHLLRHAQTIRQTLAD